MTGDELKQLRQNLGDAIGRRLSLADMAKLCGLKDPERNGKDTMRKWEEEEGPSGPVAALLSILAYASPKYPVPAFGVAVEDLPRLANGEPVVIGPEIAEPVIRTSMRNEIIRRLS